MTHKRSLFIALAVCLLITDGFSQDAATKKAATTLREQMGKFLLSSNIDGARKEKIITFALAAYQGNDFKPLWGKFTELEDEAVYHQILKNHGLGPEMLKVNLPANGTLRTSWLSPRELRKTLWFAEFCLLLREGQPGRQKWHWMNWQTNPGSDQFKHLSERFAKAILSGVTLTDRLENNFAPSNWVYQGLLETYIAIENPNRGKDQPPPEANRGPTLYIEKSIKAGDRYFRARELADYLFQQGFMTGDQLPNITTFYSEELQAGMAKFQASRGLKADGILGPETAALITKGSNPVPKKTTPTISVDKQKLLLNLNRARQLPDDLDARHLLINLASAELLAMEGEREVYRHKLLIGSSEIGKQTPILQSKLNSVVFKPSWLLSPNKAYEYLPKIRRDSTYLKRNGFQIVTRSGELVDSSSDSLDRVQSGQLFLRQRAGKNNSLGPVLFRFPNFRFIDIYASTRSDQFGYKNRAITSGRIGIEKPEPLLSWLLVNNTDRPWSRDAITQSMSSEASRSEITITEPVPIYIVYFTLIPENSGLSAKSDLYKLD